jgi:hypothetical protein
MREFGAVAGLENFLERLEYWHSYCINQATQDSASDFPPSGGIRA